MLETVREGACVSADFVGFKEGMTGFCAARECGEVKDGLTQMR